MNDVCSASRLESKHTESHQSTSCKRLCTCAGSVLHVGESTTLTNSVRAREAQEDQKGMSCIEKCLDMNHQEHLLMSKCFLKWNNFETWRHSTVKYKIPILQLKPHEVQHLSKGLHHVSPLCACQSSFLTCSVWRQTAGWMSTWWHFAKTNVFPNAAS